MNFNTSDERQGCPLVQMDVPLRCPRPCPPVCTPRPYVAFTLVIFLGAAGYYAREALAGLSTELISSFGLSHSGYGFVSTVVAIPTIVLAFGFGSILDAWGVRRCTLGYSVILALGALCVAASTLHNSVALLNTGRLFVGLGTLVLQFKNTDVVLVIAALFPGVAALLVSQKLYTKAIFPDPQTFAVAIAMVSSGLHVGGFLSLLFSVRIGRAAGSYTAGLWVALGVTIAGILGDFALLKMERNYEYDAVMRRKYGIQAVVSPGNDDDMGAVVMLEGAEGPLEIHQRKTRAQREPRGLRAVLRSFCKIGAALRSFSLRFWLVAAVGLSYYGGYIVLVAFARNLFEDKSLYGATASESSLLSASFVFLTIPFNPCIGVVANRTPQRAAVCTCIVRFGPCGYSCLLPADGVL
jgi:MFS family permease